MLTVGTYLADRYEIVNKIGAGGMSDVYKAKDHKLGRFVAIKILKQEFVDDVNFVTKFRTEAQSAASLEHPNIVNIYDVGSENGLHYIVMEYVEGITLKTYIEKKGQLSFKEAVSISIQVGRGIEAAHNKHIIHRDIKPQNIIISTEGKVKVTDFGIARAATSNTINSDVMGSVHYSSPEQARNGFVDGKSDIYSLGIVMYEMVTGRVPFDGDTTVAVAIQHLQEEMVIPSTYAPNLPISMEKIILKCTQKSPDRRYQNMNELLLDLRKALITPDEDFVTMVPLNNQDKTRVISEDEVNQIKREAEKVKTDEEEPEEEDEEDEEDLDAENGILNPKMEKAVTIMGVVAAIIIVGIIVYIIGGMLGFFKFGSSSSSNSNNTELSDSSDEDESSDSEQISMIDLKGKTLDEANSALKAAGYTSITIKQQGTQQSDEYEAGQIISQDPSAGEKVDADSKVTVVISSGGTEEAEEEDTSAVIPTVVGSDSDAAIQQIEAAGLVADRQYAYDDNVAAGIVISCSPDQGSTVTKGDTVTIMVSQGRQTTQVPNVAGAAEADARATLEAAGFVVATTSAYDDNVAEGSVISQDVAADSWQYAGTTITLTISLGVEVKDVYYTCDKTIKVPSDGHTYVSANVVLQGSDGSVIMDYGDTDVTGLSSFNVHADNIKNISSGTIIITWSYEDSIESDPDESGNTTTTVESGSNDTTTDVSFTAAE